MADNTGNDEYTKLLIHADEPGGSTTIADSSDSAHIITANGDAQVKDFNADGNEIVNYSGFFDNTDTRLTVPDHADFELGSGDFTIETYFLFSTVEDYTMFCTKWGGSGERCFSFRYELATALLLFSYSVDGENTTSLSVSWAPTTDTWYHLRVVRSGTDLYFFVNGAQVGSTQSISGTLFDTDYEVGIVSAASIPYGNGYMGVLAIHKGVALSTSAFAPPLTIAEMTNDSNTVLFLDFTELNQGDTPATITDSSASAHTVTNVSSKVSGCTFWWSGAVEFDGDGDYLTVPDSTDWDMGTLYTLDTWAFISTLAVTIEVFSAYVDDNNRTFLQIGVAGDLVYVVVVGGVPTTTLTSTTPLSVNKLHHIAVSVNGTADIFVDGVLQALTTDDTHGSFTPTANGVAIGARYLTGAWERYFNGFLSEFRISKGISRWTSNFIPPSWPYGKAAFPLLSWLNEDYNIKLGAFLSEFYGNSPTFRNFVNEVYGNNPPLIKVLNEFYGDSNTLLTFLDENYNLIEGLQAYLDERYSISSESVKRSIDLIYTLMLDNPRMSWKDLLYAIAGDTIIESSDLLVEIDGVRVYPFHVNFEFNRDSYKAFAEIHLADQESYLLCKENQSVLRIKDGSEDLYFQVEVPRELNNIGETVYVIPAESKSRVLERASAITEEFDSNMASTIVAELAGRYGIGVQWDVYNWLIPANTLYANDETPYDVIKRIVDVVGGKMQAMTNGDLRIVKNMNVSTTEWKTTTPSYYLTDQKNFFSVSETVVERGGYNKYALSNYDQSGIEGRLESEVVSETQRIIKGFKVPYVEGTVLKLYESGGTWVRISSIGWVEEEIEEEDVEVINGAGSLSNPIYSMVGWEYAPDDNLGRIDWIEDGTFNTEVYGQSLVTIKYMTRYWRWVVTDPNIEDVQFWMEEQE